LILRKGTSDSIEVIEFGQISLKQLKRDPRLLDFLIQTFMVKKRAGELTITSIESDVPFLKIKQDPAGKSRVFQIDVGLAMDRIRPGMIDGTIRIRTDDARFPELVVRVRGQIR